MTTQATNYKRITLNPTENKRLHIEIRMSDPCKNWHSDFAITAELYERGRWVAWWCLHDEILKHKPEYKILVDLHLSDIDGVPMYAIENSIYWFKDNIEKGISYLRGERLHEDKKEKLHLLALAEDKNWFYSCLVENKVFEYWKKQADDAIELMGFSRKWHNTRYLQKYEIVSIKSNEELKRIIKQNELEKIRE